MWPAQWAVRAVWASIVAADRAAADLAGVAVDGGPSLASLSGHAEDPRVATMSERVTTVLAGKLPEAQRAGRYAEDVTPTDLLMAVGMVSGLVASRGTARGRRTVLGAAAHGHPRRAQPGQQGRWRLFVKLSTN